MGWVLSEERRGWRRRALEESSWARRVLIFWRVEVGVGGWGGMVVVVGEEEEEEEGEEGKEEQEED